MAARKHKIVLSDQWKEKIKTSNIMHRLMEHVMGANDMSPTQVNAAKILLSKVVPDLARTEMTGQDGKDLIPTSIQINLIKPNAAPAS